MSPLRIDTRTPNQTVAQPATVEACQQDRAGRDEGAQAAAASQQFKQLRERAQGPSRSGPVSA
ncbi:hypothetical protein [Streptomyces sp. NPDC001165]|uniref:hypothetical protein n=1 Tax=Streptomyces sp. NPDC001165 TaxID=3364546 RepID=UPI0036C4B5A9